jgi:multidrug efflux system membrane fusion protein
LDSTILLKESMQNDNQASAGQTPPPPARPGQPSPTAAIPEHHSGASWIIIAAVCLVLAGGIVWLVLYRSDAAKKKQAAGRGMTPVVPVIAGVVAQKNVPIYLDGLGTVQAFNTVSVKARVDGQLKKVAFTEGQDVKSGDLLAQIDPAPFQTALEQAAAKKVQDEAQLANGKLDLKRETDLYAAKVDSEQVFETQKALVAQLDAAVKADQAAIDSAKVQLDYTSITSPIDGRTGLRQVDQGNIVHAADSNGLVVITQLKPIAVIFTLKEQSLGDIHKQMTSGELKVLAVDRDNTTVLGEGQLSVIDNQIDTTTGTIKLKAIFPNESLNLWPGQFVNARLLLATRTNGIVVPASVIQRGPQGAYAFVITNGVAKPGGSNTNRAAGPNPGGDKYAGKKPGGKPGAAGKPGAGGPPSDGGEILSVVVRPVTVSQTEAGEVLIESGLQPGERVVVDGQYKLQAGSQIRISNPDKTAEAGPPAKDSPE